MKDDDTRDIALAAQTSLEAHLKECDRRYKFVCGNLKELNDGIENANKSLHRRLDEIWKLFHTRWWQIAVGMVGVLFTIVLALLAYIWETQT